MPSQNIQHSSPELLSNDIREIINYKPHWVIRRGNTIFLLILVLLFSLSFAIKYPDVINAPARLTALNPPKGINAKKEGKLLKLFVSNEQQVEKDQPLGYIESGASYTEVLQLQQWIESTIAEVQAGRYNTLLSNPLPSLSNLGTLQSPYQEFQNQLAFTKQTLANGYFNKKQGALQRDLQDISVIKNNAYQQQQLVESERQLHKKEFEVYEKLAAEKVIAPMELNQYKSKLIAGEQSLKQVDVQITNADMSSHNKLKEMMDLKKQVADQQQNFTSSLLTLKSVVEEWKQQFVFTASESGKLLFAHPLQENQLIGMGQNLFYIQPPQSEFYAEVTASQNGLGKIKTGQRVLLKVESYPSQEFGNLVGTVDHIAAMPSGNDSFLIKVILPQGLKTNYDKNIFFKTGLKAQAEIITDNRKLFDRMAGQLKTIWER